MWGLKTWVLEADKGLKDKVSITYIIIVKSNIFI